MQRTDRLLKKVGWVGVALIIIIPHALFLHINLQQRTTVPPLQHGHLPLRSNQRPIEIIMPTAIDICAVGVRVDDAGGFSVGDGRRTSERT